MVLKENRHTDGMNIEYDQLWYWEGRNISLENLNGKIYGDYNEINKYLVSNNIKVLSIYPLKNKSKKENSHHCPIFNTLLILSIIFTLGLTLSSVNLFNISSKTVFLILINVFLWTKIGNLLKT